MLKSLLRTTVAAGALLMAVAPVSAEEITLKLWSRADRSGPLRAGNIVAAADTLNKMLATAGSEDRVKVELIETNARGFDADALDLLKAFSVGEGPDLFVAAHEWIGSFAENGYAANLEEHIESFPELYGDIIPGLWEATKYKNERYAVPQDSEVRMFFLNNDILRAMGKDEAFIEALPAAVEDGEFTMADMCTLAAEAVDGGHAEYGLVHRPNVGPDFQMAMASFGIDLYDEDQAKLQISQSKLTDFYAWLATCVEQGAIPADLTTWSWDEVHDAFRGGKSLSKFHGIWNVGHQMKAFNLESPAEYFNKISWIHAPAGEKGGTPSNLSHPIVYVVAEPSEHKDLAALLIGLASQPIPNTAHAVTTNHTPINNSQVAMPRFLDEGWALIAGTPMLEYAEYMPNHPMIGQYNALTFQGIQAVETGEMSPQEAAEFVIEEMEVELGDNVIILE